MIAWNYRRFELLQTLIVSKLICGFSFAREFNDLSPRTTPKKDFMGRNDDDDPAALPKLQKSPRRSGLKV